MNTTLYCYWGMVECSVGVVAACMPALEVFFRRSTWQSMGAKTMRLCHSSSRPSRERDIGCLESESPQAMLLGYADQRESKDNSHSLQCLVTQASE